MLGKSGREILKECEIKKKFEFYFKNCVEIRKQLRKGVVNVLNAGMILTEIVNIVDKFTSGDICIIISKIAKYKRRARKEYISVINNSS